MDADGRAVRAVVAFVPSFHRHDAAHARGDAAAPPAAHARARRRADLERRLARHRPPERHHDDPADVPRRAPGRLRRLHFPHRRHRRRTVDRRTRFLRGGPDASRSRRSCVAARRTSTSSPSWRTTCAQPEETLGDIRAQFAAYRASAQRRLLGMLDDERLDDLDELVADRSWPLRGAACAARSRRSPTASYSDRGHRRRLRDIRSTIQLRRSDRTARRSLVSTSPAPIRPDRPPGELGAELHHAYSCLRDQVRARSGDAEQRRLLPPDHRSRRPRAAW